MSRLIKIYLYGLPAAGYYYSLTAQRDFRIMKQKSLEYNLWKNGDLRAIDHPTQVAQNVGQDLIRYRSELSQKWLHKTLNYPRNILFYSLDYFWKMTRNYFLKRDYTETLKTLKKYEK